MRAVVQVLKQQWLWFLGIGALVAAYGPTLVGHVRQGFDPDIFADDARQQIYPFFRYADSSLFPSDYIADYYLDCFPIGFRAFYMLSAPLIDPAVMSTIVTHLMIAATVAGVGVAAHRLGGKAAAWGAMAIVLGAEVYLDRMSGGLPRTFGFPVLAWALVAYFEPFDAYILAATKRNADEPLVLPRLVDGNLVRREGDYAIIDLRQLGGVE